MEADKQAFTGPLLILSAGRSGSTYVQRILNTCGNAFIFGEHGGTLGSLARSVAHIETNSGSQIEGADIIINKRTSKQFTAWATPFQEIDIYRGIGAAFEQLYTAKIPRRKTCALWGLKEIRYDGSDLQKLIHFFPNARVIILIRQFSDFARSVHRSFWAAKDITPNNLEALLSDYIFLYSSLLCACRTYGIQYEVLYYEEAARDWRSIISAATRLLYPFVLDVDECQADDAARARVDYIEPNDPSSQEWKQFNNVLTTVLDTNGARRLHEFSAILS